MLRTYANTIAERNIAQYRLDILMTRKEVLYTKYFSTASKISDVPFHSNQHSDKMADYLSELTEKNEITGLSLDEEIEQSRNELGKLNYYANLMENQLKETTGIENELFKKIVIEGSNKTKAVEKTAEKFRKEPQTIWRYYYPKVKKILDIIKK